MKAGFYLNHSYKPQNPIGATASFRAHMNFAQRHEQPARPGFGYTNAALGIFTTYYQQSKFVEGSYIYNNIEWYLQDNWKVNSQLTLDYGLRFVHQQPQYDTTGPVVEFLP